MTSISCIIYINSSNSKLRHCMDRYFFKIFEYPSEKCSKLYLNTDMPRDFIHEQIFAFFNWNVISCFAVCPYRTTPGLFEFYRVLAQRRQHTLGNRSDKPRPPIGPRLRVQIILDLQPRAKKWAQDWHSLRPSQPVLLLGTNNSTQRRSAGGPPPDSLVSGT